MIMSEEKMYDLHATKQTGIKDIKSFIKIARKIYKTIN